MSIQVTPIPRLTVLTVPAFTLGLANAAGSAATAIASDSTLLAFDTTLPDAITYGQSGATGSATVAPRRDHSHAMAASDAVTAASEAEQVAGTSATVFTSPGRQQFHPSAAKIWVRITSGGDIEVPDYGVDAITYVATGNYTITFDENFATTVYTVLQSSSYGGGYNIGWGVYAQGSYNFQTTDSLIVGNQNTNTQTAIYGVLE